jgi:hypothetical protein
MRASSVVLVLVLACGTLLAQEPDPSMVVLGGVELCGPVDLAIDYMLTPLKGTKRYDLWMSENEAAPSDMPLGFWLFEILPIHLSFNGQFPNEVEITGYHGDVAAVTVTFLNSSAIINDKTFEEIVRTLRASKGEPTKENPYQAAWDEGDKATRVAWSLTEDYVKIQSSCEPLLRKIREEKTKAQEKVGDVF